MAKIFTLFILVLTSVLRGEVAQVKVLSAYRLIEDNGKLKYNLVVELDGSEKSKTASKLILDAPMINARQRTLSRKIGKYFVIYSMEKNTPHYEIIYKCEEIEKIGSRLHVLGFDRVKRILIVSNPELKRLKEKITLHEEKLETTQ